MGHSWGSLHFFSTKSKTGGVNAGLGVAYVFQTIEEGHDGKIDVQSVEGEGTLFKVILPLNAI